MRAGRGLRCTEPQVASIQQDHALAGHGARGGFALFPNYVGYLIGGAEPTAAAATTAPAEPEVVTTTYAIEGMSCKGCTVHIEQALAKVPTVASATVVYEEKVARVTFKPGVEPDDVAVLAAIDDTGFEATVKNDGDP